MLLKNRRLIVSLVLCLILIQSAFAENEITLPSNLKTIQQEAFSGIPIKSIDLPEGLLRIDSKAFAYTEMESVYIPESVQQIAADAFQGCSNLSPIVHLNSYADQWCTDNGYTCWHIIEMGAEYHTQEQIRQFANSHPVDLVSETTFRQYATGDPDPYAPGLISNESLESAVNMLNQIRYIVGINADVVNDSTYERQTAAAAFINVLLIALGEEDYLTHYPDRPSVLEDSSYDSLFNDAYAGASHSNLHAIWEGNSATSILSYMNDSDVSNISRVGHRRWIMNPPMKKTGFGVADLDYEWQIFAMYAADKSGSGRQTPVAWPAQQTPISYFDYDRDIQPAWSVSFGYVLSDSVIKVSLTRTKDGKVWNFSPTQSDGDFFVNDDGYGLRGCVIFRPENIGTIQNGDSFKVSVRNETDHTILNYSVSFFNL